MGLFKTGYQPIEKTGNSKKPSRKAYKIGSIPTDAIYKEPKEKTEILSEIKKTNQYLAEILEILKGK